MKNETITQINKYEIDMQNLYGGFKEYVDIQGNNRIFFSGKYGTGKTTFLKSFFKHHHDSFDVYHLYPINYQIKSNDDVVDLLKYDVLVELLRKHSNAFQETKISGVYDHLLLIREFIKNNFTLNGGLQKTLSYMEDYLGTVESVLPVKISQLGRPLQDLLKLDKQFQEFKTQYKKGDFAKVETFLESVKSHEPDGLSYIISKKVTEMRAGKPSVLILDDLDRMDPEHIFRILNVFSAFHEQEGGNKFGFDRVIVVGDIENIRHIFKHFYGPKTDFQGYIDKFYSFDIYHFKNEEVVKNHIFSIVKKLGTKSDVVIEDFEKGYFLGESLAYLLSEVNKIQKGFSLRQLLKLPKFNEAIRDVAGYKSSNSLFTQEEYSVIAVKFSLNILKLIYSSNETVLNILNQIASTNTEVKDTKSNFYRHYNKAIFEDWLEKQIITREQLINYKVSIDDKTFDYVYLDISPREVYFQLLSELVEREI